MQGIAAHRPGEPMSEPGSKPLIQRNFTLGVVNGSSWLLARALTDPDTILPAFAIALMGDNPLYVGLLVSVVNAGWFWPPLLMTPVMSTAQRRHSFYRLSAVVRVFAIFGVWASARYLAADIPALAFVAICAGYLLCTSGGGIGLIPFMSVVTDSVPAEWRGRFFATRFFFGGLMAFGAGFWVKWVLSDDSGLFFPHNYALLFGVAALVVVVSLATWWFAHEPWHKVETRRLPLSTQFIRGFRRARREPNFRRFMASRVVLAAAMGLFTPFLVPFAYRTLGMTEAMVGLALASCVLCYSMSNILWSGLSARLGNRFLLIVSGWVHMAALVLVLVTPLLPAIPLGSVLGLEFDLRLATLMLVFGAVGAARSGQFTGHMAYLLDFTPERTRSVYMATYFLAVLPMCFTPLAAALLIGAQGRYMLAFAIGGVAFLLTQLLYHALDRLRGGPDAVAAPTS